MNPFYTDYAEYLSRFYGNRKVQKISVNAGFSCPNRDGTIGHGGCIYCANSSFTPGYCFEKMGISQQLVAGKEFFARKYPAMEYIAYFQSYTNTYSGDTSRLKRIYEEALSVNGVVGLAIGTRPDCLPDEVVELLAGLNQYVPVFVELGVETMSDETLRLINRGHSAAQTVDAVHRLAEAGLHVGVHLIAGLPGEDEERIMESLAEIVELPVESLKLHHLQVLRGTELSRRIDAGEIAVLDFTPERYIDLCCKVVKFVPRRIAIERFLASAPPEMVVSPRWGLKNYQFVNLLHNRLNEEMKLNKTIDSNE